MAENPPAAVPAEAETSPQKPVEKPEEPAKELSPLLDFHAKLPAIFTEADHKEIWGVTLSAESPPILSTRNILQKYLRANENIVEKAANQLLKTLQWRKEFKPLEAKDEVFEDSKFGGLGFITQAKRGSKDGEEKTIITWNIYGAVKDKKETFGDVDKFLRWRVGLMERSIAHLPLATPTKRVPEYGAEGTDPYQMIQVHDYLSVSFLRMDPSIKAASSAAIQLFQNHYPELLSKKYFVNVPVVMGWVFNLMSMLMAKATERKLIVLSYGNQLAAEVGKDIPKAYGGETEDLKTVGEAMKMQSSIKTDAE